MLVLDVGGSVVPANAKAYVDFFNGYARELTGTREIADAAVLRTFASNEFNPAKSLVSTMLFEQALIQGKVPFAIIFDKHLKGALPYKVLVLADQDALSDDQVETIRRFVRGGGGLVATEDTSLCTDWRLRRPRFGLADVFGINHASDAGGRCSGVDSAKAGWCTCPESSGRSSRLRRP